MFYFYFITSGNTAGSYERLIFQKLPLEEKLIAQVKVSRGDAKNDKIRDTQEKTCCRGKKRGKKGV